MSVVAVTGATGFIGRHLCEYFRRLGWEVRALARNTSGYPFEAAGITLHRCDLPDVVDRSALAGADALVHCAYMTRFTGQQAAERVNELGTRRLLDEARAAGIGRLIFLSSQSAHPEAQSYYGRSKLALEQLFDDHTVVRAGLVIGREGHSLFHRMCAMVRTAPLVPLFGGGHQPIQTVHVDDLCCAIERCLAKRLIGVYSVAEPSWQTVAQFLRDIATRLGRAPLFVAVPTAPALALLRAAECFGLRLPVSSENVLGLTCLRAVDTRADLARLGLHVRTARESLDEALG